MRLAKPVGLQTIAGGDHAVVKDCPVEKIKDGFQYLFGKWLAGSKRELRPLPSFLVMTVVDGRNEMTAKGTVVPSQMLFKSAGKKADENKAGGYLCAVAAEAGAE